MNNPKKLATFGTQDTGRRPRNKNTHTQRRKQNKMSNSKTRKQNPFSVAILRSVSIDVSNNCVLFHYINWKRENLRTMTILQVKINC
jgi:hypothetical protein